MKLREPNSLLVDIKHSVDVRHEASTKTFSIRSKTATVNIRVSQQPHVVPQGQLQYSKRPDTHRTSVTYQAKIEAMNPSVHLSHTLTTDTAHLASLIVHAFPLPHLKLIFGTLLQGNE
jgi:hypothetical protein